MKKRMLKTAVVLVVTLLVLVPSIALAEGTLSFDFESDQQGWILTDWAEQGLSVSQSTERASSGSGSLDVAAKFSGIGAWQQAGVTYFLPEATDFSGYETITADLWCPPGPVNVLGNIFTNTGDDYAFYQTPDMPLIPGEWNTITLDLSDVENVEQMRGFGVKWGSSVDRVEESFFVDNVVVTAKPSVMPVTGAEPGFVQVARLSVFLGIALLVVVTATSLVVKLRTRHQS